MIPVEGLDGVFLEKTVKAGAESLAGGSGALEESWASPGLTQGCPGEAPTSTEQGWHCPAEHSPPLGMGQAQHPTPRTGSHQELHGQHLQEGAALGAHPEQEPRTTEIHGKCHLQENENCLLTQKMRTQGS